MLLPEHCSIKVEGRECLLAPSFVISVSSQEGEYMLAVVCDDHRTVLEEHLVAMQKAKRIPPGKIVFQPVKMVATDCIMGMNDDYVDLELKRGIESDRKFGSNS
jgi:hypothetical protein